MKAKDSPPCSQSSLLRQLKSVDVFTLCFSLVRFECIVAISRTEQLQE
jgi:hypothetical protein